jgi:hypothetical protein
MNSFVNFELFFLGITFKLKVTWRWLLKTKLGTIYKGIRNDGMIRCVKNHALECKFVCDLKQTWWILKSRLKWCWKKYDFAISLKCFSEGDSLLHLKTIQKRGCKLRLQGDKKFTPSSNVVVMEKMPQIVMVLQEWKNNDKSHKSPTP